MALFDPGESGYGRVGDADRALTVPATPLRVDGPTGFDPSRTDFSLSDVLAWARTKPADEIYFYNDFRECAVCQFLKDTGRCDDPAVSSNHWRDRNDDRPRPSNLIFFDSRIQEAACNSRTFGAFADRLEQALAR